MHLSARRIAKWINDALAARRQAAEFLSRPDEDRSIVFYAEDDFSYMHFESLIESLTRQHNRRLCYLTSQCDDPILESDNPNVFAYFIGNGWSRSSLFLRMRASLVIMTMPDLETYHLKRSRVADVHYLYVFHAMVSTHSNYREFAFDNYDTIFMTGPHQKEEIRATERVYSLKEKTLVDYGYPRLEALIEDVDVWRKPTKRRTSKMNATPSVILAPTWGTDAILESIGIDVVSRLLAAEFMVTVRPHPVTTRRRPDLIAELENQYGSLDRFQLQIDIRDKATLYDADVLISDWSGVAMEYAFSCQRPVVFIDVPKKSNNPNADRIDFEPIESSIRSEIGEVISPRQLDRLPDAVRRCITLRERYVAKIDALRSRYVFNLDGSAMLGASYINELTSTRTGIQEGRAK